MEKPRHSSGLASWEHAQSLTWKPSHGRLHPASFMGQAALPRTRHAGRFPGVSRVHPGLPRTGWSPWRCPAERVRRGSRTRLAAAGRQPWTNPRPPLQPRPSLHGSGGGDRPCCTACAWEWWARSGGGAGRGRRLTMGNGCRMHGLPHPAGSPGGHPRLHKSPACEL